ncbi:MAG TPA: glycosyltransferase family 1 protein [Gemmatimonadales bacterium]|nr:glycosyltransferase family 1 protein [Gemmatimonadales bacterium]
MRIGIVTDTYTPQVNGVTTVVRRIAEALDAQGHEFALAAPRYPESAPAAGNELRVASVPFPPYPAIRLSWPRPGQVARFFDAFQPDLMHVHTEGPLGLAGRRYAVERGLPLLSSFHTNFPQYAAQYRAGALAPLVWRWLAWFHRPSSAVLTPGEAIRADLERHGIGRARVWGRGVDTRHFRPDRRDGRWRADLAGFPHRPVVLHVGRLAPEKNLDILIASWRDARERVGDRATFVVAGEGPLRERIAAELPFVRWLGFLSREELARLYASADLCVLPSHTETCGLVALEAMASGIPVIAADAGGLRESVHHGVTGLLVPPSDARGFAEAIESLVNDPSRRAAFGAAARTAALERDSAQEDMELLTHYAALIGQRTQRMAACAA